MDTDEIGALKHAEIIMTHRFSQPERPLPVTLPQTYTTGSVPPWRSRRPSEDLAGTDEIAGDQGQRVEAVRQQLEDGAGHERSALHVTRRYTKT